MRSIITEMYPDDAGYIYIQPPLETRELYRVALEAMDPDAEINEAQLIIRMALGNVELDHPTSSRTQFKFEGIDEAALMANAAALSFSIVAV